MQCFEEEFYNKTRKNEIMIDAAGNEFVESSENKREIYYEKLR